MTSITAAVPDPYSALSKRQEHIAGAYIRAVCAALGCSVSVPETDDDKIDFTVSSRLRGRASTKPKIDIQSKCELVEDALKRSEYSYQIDKSLYDSLRDPLVVVPRILVLTLVPRNSESWLKQSHDSMQLHHCSYWVSLKGAPALPDGQTSKSIRLKSTNLFCEPSLHDMMKCVANGADFSSLGGVYAG